ncbi:hypothetical protein D358_00191 [Enterococcus faecalis RP2S-4]|uniref:Uncharacterized protein n=1 Tax=Enterococcus faecalis RP2S-4 TaxID=1244145 RepID=A0ABC9TPL8_ENTFL|nr:hypothetical protein D358_00191 [Enterococcus faecalis RP2S-4]
MDDYLYKIFDAVVIGGALSVSLLFLYAIVDFLCSLYFRKKDK